MNTGSDSVLQKCGYIVGGRAGNVLTPNKQENTTCTRPLWVSGGSIPLMSQPHRRFVNFIDGFRKGTEFAIFRGIHLSVTALAIYQLYNWLYQPTSLICHATTDKKRNLLGLLEFYKSSDDNVLLSVFHDALSPSSPAFSYLRYALLTPLVFGLGKGAWNTRYSHMTPDNITAELQKIQSVSSSFYHDFLRWLLPLPPIDRATSNLMKNLLWNGELEPEDLQRIFDTLATLATSGRLYTSIHALGYLAPLVYGLSLKDLRTLSQRKTQSEHEFTEHLLHDEEREQADYQQDKHLQENTEHCDEQRETEQKFARRIHTRLELKAKALAVLEEMASFHDKEGQRKSVTNVGIALYAQYLLWSLGASRSWPEAIGQFLFKGGKLFLQIKFLQAVTDALLKAEQCPQQPGVTLAGVQPWAQDLTQRCFDAYVNLFNVIPGQPTETLVGDLSQYYFPNCTVSLDLSNKALDWRAIYNITKALFDHNITIRSLNLAGNALGTMPEAANVIRDIFPTLSGIEVLDLSNNNIGANDYIDSSGTGALGEGIGVLKALTFLDLSSNYIGLYDNVNASGTVALGQGIKTLKALTSLDLSNNQIGGDSDQDKAAGTVMLAEGIKALRALTSLNLSHNSVGNDGNTQDMYAFGTIALGKGIGSLGTLTTLDLSHNSIGSDYGANHSGTIALGRGIGNLTALTFLDLSHNWIWGGAGAIALGNGLRNLSDLQILNISHNSIGCGTTGLGLDSFVNRLPSLRRLHSFTYVPQLNLEAICLSSIIIQELNRALNYTQSPLFGVLISSEDVETYCQTLPLSTQIVNLSRRLYNIAPLAMQSLMSCLANRPLLTALDMSSNYIAFNDGTNASSTVALGEGIGKLKTLTSLDLSDNGIGSNDDANASGTIALGEGIGELNQLTSLDLSSNNMQSTSPCDNSGIVALGVGIGKLGNLTFLDLSGNNIGFNDAYNASGTIALGKGVSALKSLKTLKFSHNNIGVYDFSDASGTMAIGKGIAKLGALTFLDLSHNGVGSDNVNASGTMAIGKGIAKLGALTFLDLSHNGVGASDNVNASGTVVLGGGLGALRALTFLDLSHNGIGYCDQNNTVGTVALIKGLSDLSALKDLNLAHNFLSWPPSLVALANGLNATRNLRVLNLAGNPIGSMGHEGPAALLAILPELPNLDLGQLDLSGMTNVSWTKSAGDLQRLHSQELMTACQNSRCFGGGVASSHMSSSARPATTSSFQARQLLALSEPDYPLPSHTSGASSPSSFLREAAHRFSSAYQALWDIAHHPDVQAMGYIIVGTKLTAYAAAQTLPLLVAYAAIAP